VIRKLGTSLVASRKLALSQDALDPDIDSRKMASKDLISLMVLNSLSPSLPPSQRMTDEEIFSQIATFIFAGQDTVSTSISFLLHHLSVHPPVQAQLRATLQGLGPEPTLAEVDACEYLDAVVKETLRLSPALQSTYRVAQADTVLPLKAAVTDRAGEKVREVRVRKGQLVHVPWVWWFDHQLPRDEGHIRTDQVPEWVGGDRTESYNTLTEIWGEDASEFRPERWLHPLPTTTEQNPGLYAKTMTFLDGPRSCIGFRLALAE
jgi:cytochrome P450